MALVPSQSWAQCSPDPSQTGTAVTCSATTANGYTVTTSASPLTVASGASVSNSGAAAITVSLPAMANNGMRMASIAVNGSVLATGGAGINLLSGPLGTAAYDYAGTTAAITLGASGSISGALGITLGQSAGNPNASISASLDNAGTISGISGPALATSGYYASFSSILNRSTGTIGAIAAAADSITNNGTIAGGALSAISNGFLVYGTISNTGSISSSSSAGTIVNYSGTITNGGSIINTGTGPAVTSSFLTIVNRAGGTISASGTSVISVNPTAMLTVTNAGLITNTGTGTVLSGGTVSLDNRAGATIATGAGGAAINAGAVLTLTNAGRIDGNVIAGLAGTPYSGSLIDSTTGTINGNLTLGAGNDTLVATLRDGALYTGISGAIDGGAGTNALRVKFITDAQLISGFTLPTNFSVLSLAPQAGTTVALGQGFTSAGTIMIEGAGTVNNQTTLNGGGTILAQSSSLTSGQVVNDGTINSTGAGSNWAVSLYNSSFANSGTVTAAGHGVAAGGGFNNTGTITAVGTAVSASLVAGSFTNTGTIRSTSGLGAYVSGYYQSMSNSGTIEGATAGLRQFGGTMVNRGTISAQGTGVVLLSSTSFKNEAGGIVSGNTAAIGLDDVTATGVQVVNAGTINGNVNLANGLSFMPTYGNTFYAQTGGVLNGNLTLGQGDTLVTDLANTGAGLYAGITGTVSANNSKLIYNVTGNARASTLAPTGFASLTYQLASGAGLTLSGQGAQTSSLYLAGTGVVTLDGTINLNNRILLQTVPLTNTAGYGGASSAIALTNNGAISITHDNAQVYMNSAMLMLGADSVVNNGSITMLDTTGSNASNAALTMGSGAVDSANGNLLAGSITNTGTITTTGINAIGLSGGYTTVKSALTNSGQISSNLAAVLISGSGTIVNSGSLISTSGAAIHSTSFQTSTHHQSDRRHHFGRGNRDPDGGRCCQQCRHHQRQRQSWLHALWLYQQQHRDLCCGRRHA